MRKLKMIFQKVLIMTLILFLWGQGKTCADEVIILCYHDIPQEVNNDKYGVDQRRFINTIEYFKAHGFDFVSLDDVLAANEGKLELPSKPILLTFDDGYLSFYDFVYPILKEYKIPSVLAVVSKWLDGSVPENMKLPLMNWEQIKEVAQSPYVDIISHSHDLHKGVIYNPQGNTAPAAVNRIYDPVKNEYENEESYRKRIHDDLKISVQALKMHAGQDVVAIAWPYGWYNQIAMEEGKKLGFKISFSLNDLPAQLNGQDIFNRYLIYKNPTIQSLLKDLKIKPAPPEHKRIVQVDLDWIYDEDSTQRHKNLSEFLNRIKALKPSTVYLQAFSDLKGNGNVESVYFPNRVLPMRADFFNRVAHQLKTRVQVEVYAWMPMLSITLPDEDLNKTLRVKAFKDGTITLSESWYHRLSPFSKQTHELLKKLYADLAIHTMIDGVVFQDDGYLNDFEDFHPSAKTQYELITGGELKSPEELTEQEMKLWTKEKITELNTLNQELIDTVKFYRPEAKFTRTYYALALTDQDSEEWLAQSYSTGLDINDYVMIMAYPRMEKKRMSNRWLAHLVQTAQTYPGAMEKTIFKIQAYDWKKKKWIKAKVLNQWFKTLVAGGAKHIGYYPDDYIRDRPKTMIMREMISVEDFPFKRDWK